MMNNFAEDDEDDLEMSQQQPFNSKQQTRMSTNHFKRVSQAKDAHMMFEMVNLNSGRNIISETTQVQTLNNNPNIHDESNIS